LSIRLCEIKKKKKTGCIALLNRGGKKKRKKKENTKKGRILKQGRTGRREEAIMSHGRKGESGPSFWLQEPVHLTMRGKEKARRGDDAWEQW